jgi:Ca2+-binding EF-hand superfamily protein
MSSISSISGTSGWASYASVNNNQKAQTASVVDKLFQKLDTKQQGFLDKSELQTALSANVSGNSASSASADDMFSAMDADGDGKITKQELGNTLQSLADKMDNLAASMRVRGGRDKSGADKGFTQDQLTQMAQNTSGTDSKRSAFMSELAANFTQADTNGDGKVNRTEAMAYAKAKGLEQGPQAAGGPQGAGGPPPGGPPPVGGASDSSATDSTATASTDPADTNGDGKVSAKEAVDYLLSQLAAAEDSSKTSDTSSPSASKTDLDQQLSRQILQLVKTYGLGSSTASAANDASSVSQALSASA